MSNINEENIDHAKRSYPIPSKYANVLGNKPINGNNMTTKLSRLKNKKRTENEESAYQWLNRKNEESINQIDAKKKIVMDTEGVGGKKGGNAYKKTHKKDGIPNATEAKGPADMSVKGKRSRIVDQIKNNRVQYYESYNKEMEDMKYLIEYMNNNNKPNII